MKLIDTHAHLYDQAFNQDRNEVIERLQKAGIIQVYMPNIDLSTIQPMIDLANSYPKLLQTMIGLHPCYVRQNYLEVLKNMEKWIGKESFVGVGEIGLDACRNTAYFNEQKKAFAIQLKWARAASLPVVIHSRKTLPAVIEILETLGSNLPKTLLHCFSGKKEEAKRLINMGCYLGIGGLIASKSGMLKKVLKDLTLERIVLETDSPYLSPHGKERNEPSNLLHIIKSIEFSQSIPLERIAQETTKNACELFNFSPFDS